MKISYLDNLKIFLIALVLAHHAGQSYQIGAASWLISDPDKAEWISILISSNTTFFMGLFFFISAYFLPGSYEKTIPSTLLKKKFIRLGIPTLFVVFFVLPLSFYYFGSRCGNEEHHASINFTFGHTWFIVQLLLYSTLYIVFRKFFGSPKTSPQIILNHTMICLYTLALFATTSLVSYRYPINNWTFYHLFEPFHLPQYISLFFLGILAYKHNWLETLKSHVGYTWLLIGIICVIYYAVHEIIGIPLFYIFWSSVMCSAWCIGLLTLFRDYMHCNGSLHRFLSACAYGVYLFHVPFVWYAQCLLLPYHWSGTYKFLIAFIITYIASHIFVGLLRKISFVRQVI